MCLLFLLDWFEFLELGLCIVSFPRDKIILLGGETLEWQETLIHA